MLRWFINNKVASNLLMIAIILGGALSFPLLDREVMPAIPLDMVQIDVIYPGASPLEIEERICIRIEEAIHDLEGIEHIYSEAVIGRGGVRVEIAKGFSTTKMLGEIKARVDALDTLPEDAEEPLVQQAPWSVEIIELVVSANTDETALRDITYQVRDDVARLPGIDEVIVQGLRQPEMAIEVSEFALQKYNLTFSEVVEAVKSSSVNLSGGAIKASNGDIAIRTFEQAYEQSDYENIVVLTKNNGTRVLLGDIADVVDGFEETNIISRFNNEPAATILIKVRNNPDVIAATQVIRDYVEQTAPQLPAGVNLEFWLDKSETFNSRSTMLVSSGLLGLGLVFILLTFFLRPAIAVWVCVGIFVSFMGAIFVIPSTPISVNMMTLFAFILVLGIVVDDAIIIGESIHVELQQGHEGKTAVYNGARRVAKPVIFAAVTTMIAFSPALFIDGSSAKLTMPLSVVVILALAFSLIEAFLILPAHLAHLKRIDEESDKSLLGRARYKTAKAMTDFSELRYKPLLEKAINNRYQTLAMFVAAWLIVMSFLQGGWVKSTFYPLIPGDNIIALVTLSDGASFENTKQVIKQIEDAANQLREELKAEYQVDLVKNLSTYAKENSIRITLELIPTEDRDIPIQSITERWRNIIGFIPDTKSYTFDYHIIDKEPAIKLGLTADSIDTLTQATNLVELELASYDGLYTINNSQRSARPEVRVNPKDTAENFNVSREQIATQVRQGFFGEEVQRIPRGQDEVKVMIRYPKESRSSLEQLNRMRIRSGDDLQIPIGSVANLSYEEGISAIRRFDRRRIIEVTAEADPEVADPDRIVDNIRNTYVPGLKEQFPDLEFLVQGQQDAASKFFFELVRLTLLALLATFGLIAIAFRSYIQPAIVMSAVPFGLLGAIIGHLVFDTTISMFSFMGVVAAAGVVINDNLVLIDRINQIREEMSEKIAMTQAVIDAATSRFRPIILTSFTTFIGLLPIMSEQSAESEYLKPMTLSLGFGVAFASVVTLFLVPCLYLIVEDIKALIQRRKSSQQAEISLS